MTCKEDRACELVEKAKPCDKEKDGEQPFGVVESV